MNRKTTIALFVMVALALGSGLGFLVGTLSSGSEQAKESAADSSSTAAKPLYWVAPMDPNYRRDKPGKSPMGMDLVPVYEEPDKTADTITISPAVENNLGVRTEPVRVGPLWRRIEATAYVGLDETLISNISTRTEGWVSRLYINAEGERVRKNDLLFELYSPEIVNAQKEYLQARKRGEERLIAGSVQKMRALGLVQSEIAALEKSGKVSEHIRVVAPQDGIVSKLNVREGIFVQPNTLIMSLAGLSSVWLQAEVFESQAEWVAAGQMAKATLDYLPGQEFNGQVDYVYPVLDPKTRTLRVRLRFENPAEMLKPNMYARVSIYGKLHANALSISREALIRSTGSNRVVLALGEGRFQVTEVLTGMESGDYVEILAGLEENDQIVTSAQFLLDSEASLGGGIRRLSANTLPQERQVPESILASGKVDAVYPERRRIRISHGPIDALAWPAMTMEFDVLGAARLDSIEPGQNIWFSLDQQLAGDFAIIEIGTDSDRSVIAESPLESAELDSPAPGDGAAEHAEDNKAGGEVWAEGVVIDIDHTSRILKLKHAPIEALGWPSMTMNFDVSETVDLKQLEKGQSIRFSLGQPGAGNRIEAFEVLGESPADTTELPGETDQPQAHGTADHD